MNTRFWSWILILTVVAAGLFLRILPLTMSVLDDRAAFEIRQETAQAVKSNVQKQYPSLDDEAVSRIGSKVLKETWKTDKAALSQKITLRAQELKDRYRDPSGHLYFGGLDSYYWLHLLENLLSKGQIGDKLVDGKPYDSLIGKTIDPATSKNIHIWLGYLFYKTAAFFHSAVRLESALFFLPLFLSSVIALVGFFAARRLGCNVLGSFMASVAINLSPFLITRMVSEWFDTDVYNVLFPLLIFCIFLFAAEKTASLTRRIVLSALSGVCVAFYASTWKGWWFIFDILILSGLLYLLNRQWSRREEAVPSEPDGFGLSLALFFGWTTIFVILLNGVSVWLDCVFEPLRLAHILNVTETSMWPNVYQTVAELAPVQPASIVSSLGGSLVFFSALLGFLYLVLGEHALRDSRSGFGLMALIFWIVATFYSALEASRFILLLVVPVGIGFGIAVSKFYEFAMEILRKYTKGRTAQWGSCALVACLALYPVFDVAQVARITAGMSIMMNDQWYGILTNLKNKSPENAIINSWWDFGHWFKTVAGRRVLFDGMTQNSPYAYWTAAALLTDDPRECLGILRMINTSDNQAFDILSDSGRMNPAKAVSVIRACLKASEVQAKADLNEVLEPADAEKVFGLLFPEELPPVYLVVSYDMPGKIAPISYIGNWNFENVDLWFKHKKKTKQQFLLFARQQYGLSESDAEARYMEMIFSDEKTAKEMFTRYLRYYSPVTKGQEHAGMRYFQNGLVVDNLKKQGVVASRGDFGVPQNLYYIEDGYFQEAGQKDSTLKFSGLLIGKEGDSKSLLCDTELARSMLIRLYFYKGEGLDFVKMFDESVDENGDAIYVYEVIWHPEKAVKAKEAVPSKKKTKKR